MKTSDYFFIMSAVYVAPHFDEASGIIFAIIFCGLALFSKIIDK